MAGLLAFLRRDRPEKIEVNPYHLWAARFWHGMTAGVWFPLLARNRFRVHPKCWGLAFTISFASIINSLLRPLEQVIYGRRIARTEIKDAPIFIIGHWRSGTTLLHELLVLDDRHSFPTTYECFAPHHFLVSAWFITRMRFLLPSQRPMDNMAAGWERPQEDEFALVNLGLPSPYLTMTFPNEPPRCPEYFSLEEVSPDARARWKAGLLSFLRHVTFRNPKRMVLKSPPHTARIKAILEIFPDARFVHIVRDPHVIFPSTVKLWKTLYKFQALQNPRYEHLEEYVFDCFERMYDAFENQRHLVDADRLIEIRYEDLVADKVGQMRSLYERLSLGEFEKVLPKLEEYLAGVKEYKTNRYQIDPELAARIDQRWGPHMQKYGYCQPA